MLKRDKINAFISTKWDFQVELVHVVIMPCELNSLKFIN